ncbi:threonine/serine exporter family protein, partial [Faecalibaculum rodentium]
RNAACSELQVYGELSRKDPGTLLARTAVLAGRILLESGAETGRTEDTMSRICQAGGAVVTDSYVTPGMLMISFTWNGQMIHNMKRVGLSGTDLGKIQQVNALSRQLQSREITLEDCYRSLCQIQEEPGASTLRMTAGAALAAAGFALVFGGSASESAAAAVSAALCAFLLENLDFCTSSLRTLLGSSLITLAGVAAGALFGIRANMVILAALMILVPGMLFTTALRDCIAGDTLSGQARLSMAILSAAAIALGNIGTLLILEAL